MPKKRSFKNMREVAAQLPAQFTEGKMTVKGDFILGHNPEAVDKNGKAIEPKTLYEIPTQQRVNHYRRIKKLFSSGGYPAVIEYVNGVASLEVEAAMQHHALMSTMPSQPMSI